MIRDPLSSELYASHLTNPRLLNDAGTVPVDRVFFSEYFHCTTIRFGHKEFVVDGMAKGLHRWKMVGEVEVLNGVRVVDRLLFGDGFITPNSAHEILQS